MALLLSARFKLSATCSRAQVETGCSPAAYCHRSNTSGSNESERRLRGALLVGRPAFDFGRTGSGSCGYLFDHENKPKTRPHFLRAPRGRNSPPQEQDDYASKQKFAGRNDRCANFWLPVIIPCIGRVHPTLEDTARTLPGGVSPARSPQKQTPLSAEGNPVSPESYAGRDPGADEVEGSTAEPPRPAPLPRYTSRRPKQRTDARALSHHQRATTAHRTSPENMSKKPPNMPSQQDQLGQTWEQQQESPDRPPSRPTDYKTRPLAKLKNRRTRPPGLHQRFAGSPRTSRPKNLPVYLAQILWEREEPSRQQRGRCPKCFVGRSRGSCGVFSLGY